VPIYPLIFLVASPSVGAESIVDDRPSKVKIRQPEGGNPKYAEAFRDRPAIYPALSVVRPGKPLVIVEGESDCLLLAQARPPRSRAGMSWQRGDGDH
jgi:hypothetical protein